MNTDYRALPVSPSSVQRPSSFSDEDTLQDLKRWLDDQRSKNCASVVLTMPLNRAFHAVYESQVDELVDTAALAMTLYREAARETAAQNTSQLFYVMPIHLGRSQPAGRFSFRIECDPMMSGAERTADSTGIIRMLMDHTQASATLAIGHSQSIVDMYERVLDMATRQKDREIERMAKRIESLERREDEARELRYQLEDQKHERLEKRETAERAHQMQLYALERLGEVGGVLVRQLLLRKSLPLGSLAPASAAPSASSPASGSDVEAMLGRFITSLTAEQGQAIAAVLTMEQQALLAQIAMVVSAHAEESAPDNAPAPAPSNAGAPNESRSTNEGKSS